MSFHIHVLKNNAYKFARLNNVALNPDFYDKRVDNVKAEEVQKLCGVKRRKQPDKSIKSTLPVIYNHVIFKPLQTMAATQTLPGLYQTQTRNPYAFQMFDVERILASASVPQSDVIKDDNYATQYSHTFFRQVDYTSLSDSIISQENLSITMYPTEHIQNVLKEMNSIKNEMDRMRDSVFQCSSGDIDNKPSSEPNSKPDGAPSQQQLNEIKNVLTEYVPNFFEKNSELQTDCYHENITFENHFFKQKQVTQGIQYYWIQLTSLRSLGRLYYSKPRMEILSMSSNIEHGTVVIRWRVSGVPQLRAFTFWKFKSKEPLEIAWHEGISTFYVKDDGLIHLHKLERILVDRGPIAKKAKTLAATLAIALGLIPKPSSECSPFWMKRSNSIGK